MSCKLPDGDAFGYRRLECLLVAGVPFGWLKQRQRASFSSSHTITRSSQRFRRAVSMVEVLIVIAIIGLLLQLALPAVQAARESARRTQCMNNLRQIGVGCLLHETSQKHLPTGGWGFHYTGDPDRGFDAGQPGGWIYNILPYVELENVRKIGSGLKGYKSGEPKFEALGTLRATQAALFYCPTRRRATDYPVTKASMNAGWPLRGAKTDYAGNGGSIPAATGGPTIECLDTYPDCAWGGNASIRKDIESFDGIIGERSAVKMQDITDGGSKTMLSGEKSLPPPAYKTGNDAGDDDSMYTGNDMDVTRWVGAGQGYLPIEDIDIEYSAEQFGSAHSKAFHVAFCDGRVVPLSYLIDPKVFVAIGTRAGGEATPTIEP